MTLTQRETLLAAARDGDVPALLSALDAAEGREKRLRKALRGVLKRDALQPQEIQGYPDVRFYCRECERVWNEGQPEQHAPECRLVEWRELASESDRAGEG